MKKQSRSTMQARGGRSSRENPEGVSISKGSKASCAVPSPSPTRKSPKARRRGQTSTAGMWTADSGSSLDQTPESLSQISSIMPPDDTALTLTSRLHSPAKRRRGNDTTMELAVQFARGEPDGADEPSRKSPKMKAGAKKLADIEEAEEPSGQRQDKENSTMVAQKATCMKVPLKQAGKKLKSLKTLGGKNRTVSTKVKKNFDKTLPNETLVPKKPKLTWKEKKKERKMVRNNYELIQKAKGLWEDLRRQKLSEEKRKELCKDLHDRVEGKVKELSVVHDSARIVQCLVQYGGPEYRTAILEEIKPHVAELSKNKYGKFIIRKLLKYGTKGQRGVIIKGFQGCVRKLIRHKEAADIVDYAYNDFATAPQRLFLLEEFYGPAFTMFRTQSTRSLDDIMEDQPDKRTMIMSNMKESLLPLIDKQILTLTMVHKMFADFFKYADGKLQKDMIEALRESVVHLLHTKDGARVAMACVWGGSAKDRKVIVKSLKGHVGKVCREEAGHMALLAIFDSVDDTVLVQKAILDELLKDVERLMHDVNGRKVLTYLLVRRDHLFFCPDVILQLQQGDANTTSKKDAGQRARELRDYVSLTLLTYLTEHAAALLADSHTSLMVPLILSHASGDLSVAMDALAAAVVSSCDPSGGQGGERGLSLVEDPAGHIALKKILSADRERMLQGKDALFSVALLTAAEASTYKAWVASNRGCFMLITLLEVENAQVTQVVMTQLCPLKKYLKKMTFKGAEILLRKLDGQPGAKAKKPLEISL